MHRRSCCRAIQGQPPGEEEEESPPPLFGEFVRRPLAPAPLRRTAACRRCAGSTSVPCAQCGGTGLLARGGYQKRNPVSAARVLDSKWTALERTFGWRHFRVVQKRGQGKATMVLMQSTCDASTQFWLNMQNLKERERWASGWLQKDEMRALEAQLQAAATQQQQRQQQQPGMQRQRRRQPGQPPTAAGGGTVCKGCGGSGSVPCPLCSNAGEVVEL